jgi:hypothetical protein
MPVEMSNESAIETIIQELSVICRWDDAVDSRDVSVMRCRLRAFIVGLEISFEMLVTGLIYLGRLLRGNPECLRTVQTCEAYFLTACVVSMKLHFDGTEEWGQFWQSRMMMSEMDDEMKLFECERRLLSAIDYDLFVSKDAFDHYYEALRRKYVGRWQFPLSEYVFPMAERMLGQKVTFGVSTDPKGILCKTHKMESAAVTTNGPRARIRFFEAHLDKLDWEAISSNFTIPVEFLEKHADKLDWNVISMNDSLPLAFFERHLDKTKWRILLERKRITSLYIETHLDLFEPYPDTLNLLKMDSLTTERAMEFVARNMRTLCNKRRIDFFSNKGMSMTLREKYFDQHRALVPWVYIFEEGFVTSNYIIKNIDYFRNYERLEMLLGIDNIAEFPDYSGESPVGFFKKHLDASAFDWLKAHSLVSLEFVERYIESSSNWIRAIKILPIDELVNRIDRFYWRILQAREIVTFDILEQNPDKIDWGYVSSWQN